MTTMSLYLVLPGCSWQRPCAKPKRKVEKKRNETKTKQKGRAQKSRAPNDRDERRCRFAMGSLIIDILIGRRHGNAASAAAAAAAAAAGRVRSRPSAGVRAPPPVRPASMTSWLMTSSSVTSPPTTTPSSAPPPAGTAATKMESLVKLCAESLHVVLLGFCTR